eukprot:CAMPEP_0202686546 /NCGR_PEP_ID=MMETSP1385-20130828/2293_1 /ASSEMBLY_ACC=CAM_ASM_000861 /TAXON_ID=933848 /ORGANISM="Elphidium margaritaceum" /LENGTH=263 /DNA_ID=CAMNT_0049341141 /DNA_START=32 /DNA_END=823 /DNA_ORIENTATION=+
MQPCCISLLVACLFRFTHSTGEPFGWDRRVGPTCNYVRTVQETSLFDGALIVNEGGVMPTGYCLPSDAQAENAAFFAPTTVGSVILVCEEDTILITKYESEDCSGTVEHEALLTADNATMFDYACLGEDCFMQYTVTQYAMNNTECDENFIESKNTYIVAAGYCYADLTKIYTCTDDTEQIVEINFFDSGCEEWAYDNLSKIKDRRYCQTTYYSAVGQSSKKRDLDVCVPAPDLEEQIYGVSRAHRNLANTFIFIILLLSCII